MVWSLIPVGPFVGTSLVDPLGASTVIIIAAPRGTLVAAGLFFSPLSRLGSKTALP